MVEENTVLLKEDKDDPVYTQETYNAYLLLALSNERGGNRDEVKNDIRAIPEVLTVSPVEASDGGVQKQLDDYFLSTVKLRVRLPADEDRDLLTQHIVKEINRMRGIAVRRHIAQRATELREEEEDYQTSPERMRRLRKGFKRLTRKGGNTGGPFKRAPLDPDWKSAPPGAPGGLEERIKIKIRAGRGQLITSFETQPVLNTGIWEGVEMRPEIRERLQEIAQEFINNLELTDTEIKDIILTGSLANYNWSEYSDLDVHIVLDFAEIGEDEDLVKKYFDAVRSNWNKVHDIRVKGHEVELYVQDDEEEHASTGIYSLLEDEWVVMPTREEPELDMGTVYKKARHLIRDIEKVEKYFRAGAHAEALSSGKKIKEKIKTMRRTGLQRAGIFSAENLAFKVLRRSGHMKKLFDTTRSAYDAQKTLAEQE